MWIVVVYSSTLFNFVIRMNRTVTSLFCFYLYNIAVFSILIADKEMIE